VLGLIPGLYFYFDEGQSYEEKLAEITSQEATVRAEFEKARQRKSDLPKLEEKLAFTEDQLTKAKKLLPDSYIIESILEKAATLAYKTNVVLERFKPLAEIGHDSDGYRYMELPIETQITGDYQSIATFFDKVAHLDTTIFIRNIAITPAASNATLQQRAQAAQGNLVGAPGGAPNPAQPGLGGQPNDVPPTPDALAQQLNQPNPMPPMAGALPQNGALVGGMAGGQPGRPLGTGLQPIVNLTKQDTYEGFKETAKFNLVIYRSLSDGEPLILDPNAPNANGRAPMTPASPATTPATPRPPA
jgi:Tfp pilus assembly protein PilO